MSVSKFPNSSQEIGLLKSLKTESGIYIKITITTAAVPSTNPLPSPSSPKKPSHLDLTQQLGTPLPWRAGFLQGPASLDKGFVPLQRTGLHPLRSPERRPLQPDVALGPKLHSVLGVAAGFVDGPYNLLLRFVFFGKF